MPQFTKQAIIQSFLRIAEKKPVSKITVRDIVDDCGVNRNTFYYHFQDIYALIEEVITNQMLRTVPDGTDSKYLTDVFTQTVLFMLEHKPAFLNIYRSVGREVFENMTQKNATVIFSRYIDSKMTEDRKISEEDRNILIRFYMHAVLGILYDWISRGMTEDVGFIMRRLRILMTGTADRAIQNSIDHPADEVRI